MPVSTPSDPQAAALLAHVLQQTQVNINFLASQNYISHAEAGELISRLTQGPASRDATLDSVATSMQNLAVGPVRAPSPVRRGVPPPPPRQTTKRARALWPYNEDGREVNDISFSAGETVEIVDETNADWWTGKCRGKQGLFPANYVELLDAGRGPPSPAAPPSMPGMPMHMNSYHQPPPGPPQYGMMPNEPEKAAMYHQQSYGPPAPMQPAPPAQVVQQEQQAPPKKNKFGKLGSTMATSAAGGVGFGAGAAIGSGIINSIF